MLNSRGAAPYVITIAYLIFVAVYFGVFGPMIAFAENSDFNGTEPNFTGIGVNSTDFDDYDSGNLIDYVFDVVGFATSGKYIILNALLFFPLGAVIVLGWVKPF